MALTWLCTFLCCRLVAIINFKVTVFSGMVTIQVFEKLFFPFFTELFAGGKAIVFFNVFVGIDDDIGKMVFSEPKGCYSLHLYCCKLRDHWWNISQNTLLLYWSSFHIWQYLSKRVSSTLTFFHKGCEWHAFIHVW